MCLKRLEELTTELQNIDMFISSFINTSPILAWIKDFNGNFIYANSVFIEYFNLKSIDDILNKKTFSGYLLKNSQQHIQNDELAAKSSNPIELIETLYRDDTEIQFYTIKFKIDKTRRILLFSFISNNSIHHRQFAFKTFYSVFVFTLFYKFTEAGIG